MEKPEKDVETEDHCRKEWLKMKIEFEQKQASLGVVQGENKKLRSKYEQIAKECEEMKKDYEGQMSNQIKQLNQQISENEENTQRIDFLEKEYDTFAKKVSAEQEVVQFEHKAQMLDLNQKLLDLGQVNLSLEEFGKQREMLTARKDQLEVDLKSEKKMRQKQINELERDKIKATETLRKEMLYKIKETKANLLALNDEQLQTTTRLTILQNHQLTTELEYQSKQTEQLLNQNQLMTSQIEVLKRDIAIHKEVESELAKRSHFCQKVIKRLKEKIKQLESDSRDVIPEPNSTLALLSNRANGTKSGLIPHTTKNRNGRVGQSFDFQNLQAYPQQSTTASSISTTDGNNDLITYLEHRLEDIEKKLTKQIDNYNILQTDYSDLQDKMNISREKYKRAALLLTEYLDDVINGSPNILQGEHDIHLNIDSIKNTPIEKMRKEDKISLVLVLLKQLQPYLSSTNMATAQHQQMPPPQRMSKMTGSHLALSPIQQSSRKKENVVRQQADQILKGSRAERDVDALANILDHVNVHSSSNANFIQSSKRNNFMSPQRQRQSGRQLPPLM